MPVGTLAQAMVEDALSYHQKQEGAGTEGASAPSQDVMVADNAAIYRLYQPKVGTDLMYVVWLVCDLNWYICCTVCSFQGQNRLSVCVRGQGKYPAHRPRGGTMY